ncbi:hypothetical protein MRX96_017282 [Rhipicephalus microplus]
MSLHGFAPAAKTHALGQEVNQASGSKLTPRVIIKLPPRLAPRRVASRVPRGVTSYFSGSALRAPCVTLVRARIQGSDRLGEYFTVVGVGVIAPAVPPSTDPLPASRTFAAECAPESLVMSVHARHNKLAGLMLV